jgi:N-acetylmuramoyl-L-alanine amidase
VNGNASQARNALIVAIIALLLGGTGLTIALVDDDGDGRADGVKIVKTKVNEQAGGLPASDVEVPAPVVAAAAPLVENQLRDESPAEAPPGEVQAVRDQVEQVKRERDPLPTAGASAGFRGCTTKFVSNQSSRRGVRPIYQVLHYTVSPNRPGWSDVNAIIALFDRASSQASSHFIIDREGNCAYIVPITSKSWTQAAGNPLAVSYEIINSGRESSFMDTAGYAKLKSVAAQVRARTGIPTTAGNVAFGKPGVVQHKDGGLAWGGHVDITPFSKEQVIKVIGTPSCGKNCRRARDLRKRNVATHKSLRARRCAPPARTRSSRCRFYHRRHAAIHAAAKREGIRL